MAAAAAVEVVEAAAVALVRGRPLESYSTVDEDDRGDSGRERCVGDDAIVAVVDVVVVVVSGIVVDAGVDAVGRLFRRR